MGTSNGQIIPPIYFAAASSKAWWYRRIELNTDQALWHDISGELSQLPAQTTNSVDFALTLNEGRLYEYGVAGGAMLDTPAATGWNKAARALSP